MVLYNPESEDYLSSIDLLLNSGISVIIYDNTPSEEIFKKNKLLISSRFSSDVILLSTKPNNIGLSKAFNLAAILAQEKKFEAMFLFDQDTNINTIALSHLINSFNMLTKKKNPFGIIAGYPVRKDGIPYRIRPLKGITSSIPPLKEVVSVPSSFSLIPVKTFQRIGLFNEDFFIDHIDMDFSMRSRLAGLPVYLNTDAIFVHNVGIGDVKIFNKYLFPIGDPYRHYYQVRNMILSYNENKVSRFTIIKEVALRALVVSIISIDSGNYKARFRYLIKGIKDGFNGINGKLKS